MGSRLFFWLQPVTMAFTDIGYPAGVVLAFSISTPRTLRWTGSSGPARRSAAVCCGGVASMRCESLHEPLAGTALEGHQAAPQRAAHVAMKAEVEEPCLA